MSHISVNTENGVSITVTPQAPTPVLVRRPGVQGIQGIQGIAATIAVGSVSTVDYSDPAAVANSGTPQNAVFDFFIPRGVPGVVQSIGAGSNVSVDSSDPANPVISATGTVTSVDVDVPTGFDVSGGPVTSSGTITITYATGYQGYTSSEASKLSGIEAGAEVNVKADWNAVSGDAEILNKPALGTAAAADTTDFATAAQGGLADTAVQPGDLATVATTGAAANVSYSNATSGLTATQVQAAIDELAASGGDVAGDTHAAASKTTPVDADELPLADSAASWGLKKLTWANLKATLAQSTATDTTAGKLLTVGAFGLGAQLNSTETNIDNYKVPGDWITPASGLTNLPSGWSSGRHVIKVSGGTGYAMQIMGQGGGSRLVAFRVWNGTDWSAWREIPGIETGTWTPSIEYAAQTLAPTYTSRQGNYIRMGKIVFASFAMIFSSKGAGGSTSLAGLPFVSRSGFQYSSNFFYSAWASVTGFPLMEVQSSAATARIYIPGATAVTSVTPTTHLTDTSQFYGTCVYEAAS